MVVAAQWLPIAAASCSTPCSDATTALDLRGFGCCWEEVAATHADQKRHSHASAQPCASGWQMADFRTAISTNRIPNATARAIHTSVDTDSKGKLSINKL